MKKLTIPLITIILLIVSGCTNTPIDSTSSQTDQPQLGQMASPVTRNYPEVSPLKDPNNILFKRATYFDLDKYDIKEEYRPIITAHVQYLVEHPKASIVITGHCDERGSRKYNQMLGLKRANAVKQLMISMGVSEKQIKVISLGKDKPNARGHSEVSWAENRRAVISYAGEKNTAEGFLFLNKESPY